MPTDTLQAWVDALLPADLAAPGEGSTFLGRKIGLLVALSSCFTEVTRQYETLDTEAVQTMIRALEKPDDIQYWFDILVPCDGAPSIGFWDGYSEKDRLVGRKLCILGIVASQFRLTPREYQLDATIAFLAGKDVLVDVGTGYGKTLCMILAALYMPAKVLLIVSPLKRLQDSHVTTIQDYGLTAIAINEDTPSDESEQEPQRMLLGKAAQ
jgi:DEAD/DEAH box helicase